MFVDSFKNQSNTEPSAALFLYLHPYIILSQWY